MSIVHDLDDRPDPDLGPRLDAMARSATAGLGLDHPADVGVARLAVAPRRARTGRWVAAVAAIAAAVGLVGIAVWSAGSSPSETSVAADATSTSAAATPAEQLRAAIAATRDGAPFRVTDDELLPVQPLDPAAADEELDWVRSVWTYDRDGRVALSWADPRGDETPIRLVHDPAAGQLYWAQRDGSWRRAPIAQDQASVVAGDPLQLWASANCVAAVGERELVIVATPGECPADPAADPNALHLRLRPDGRIDRIEHGPTGGPGDPGTVPARTSVFSYDHVAPVELPDPSTVTDVPTPVGFGWSFGAGADGAFVEVLQTPGG